MTPSMVVLQGFSVRCTVERQAFTEHLEQEALGDPSKDLPHVWVIATDSLSVHLRLRFGGQAVSNHIAP